MKKVILAVLISLSFFITSAVLASNHICYGQSIDQTTGQTSQIEKFKCDLNQLCDPLPQPHCVDRPAQGPLQDVFGRIEPPEAIVNLGPGAIGISTFLNNIITLIYVAAGIIFVFMVVISALQWITSGGEKEKIAGARQRLTYAIIGITLLALSFFIIRLIGQITGFTFFEGQNNLTPQSAPGIRTQQTLAPYAICLEAGRAVGSCDEFNGYFCIKADDGGGIFRCMPRPTPTLTPTPYIQPQPVNRGSNF